MRVNPPVATIAAVTLQLNGWLRRKPVSRESAVAGRLTEAGRSQSLADGGAFTGADVTVVVLVLDDAGGAARLGETAGVAEVVFSTTGPPRRSRPQRCATTAPQGRRPRGTPAPDSLAPT